MTYDETANEVIKLWNCRSQHILYDIPRDYEKTLAADIATALKNERDACLILIDQWIERLHGAASRDVLEMLYVVRDDISLRGCDGPANLPLL